MGTKLTINALRFFWLKLLVGYCGNDFCIAMEPFLPELHPNPGWSESIQDLDATLVKKVP